MAPTAPPIEGDLWINSAPLSPEHLRGRTVVLVFWTASCEASLRRLQQIEALVAGGGATGDPDTMAIAVHSPRMTCDDDVDRLHHTIERYRVTIPVVHDPRYLTWTRYEPPGWPSTTVIDRHGRATGIAAGCRDIELIEQALDQARSEIESGSGRPGGRRRDDDVAPISLPPGESTDERGRPRRNPLALDHPGGLAVWGTAMPDLRIAVADTGHDRILVGTVDTDHRGVHLDTVVDGVAAPEAVVFTGETTLVVVERGTNSVSEIDLVTGRTATITDQLVRPVGLARDLDGSVVITDAGQDRIFRATANSDRTGHLVLPIAGSGQLGVRAGRADRADLAQPVAVVRTGAGLVFADAASSNLRLLTDRGEVVNITDSDLFDWGLLDGPAHRARLQRPSGLAALPDGSVLVVDRGNDRLRRLHHRRIETIGLSGLSSPTAVAAVDGERVLVADSNNHRLLVVDPIRHDAWAVAVGGVERARALTVTAADDQVSSGSTVSAS